MNQIIWSDKPLIIDYNEIEKPRDEEERWEREVLPIGNGRLGGTVFGDPKKERIQFNQESLWVGNEDNTGGYQPFGDIYIELDHKNYKAYRRELDIEKAVQTISYESNGVNYKREYFSSYPAQCMVMHLSADKKASLSGFISMDNVHEIPIVAEENKLIMKGDTSDFWWWKLHLKEPKRLIAGREYASEDNINLDFEAQVRVKHEGGELVVKGDKIEFINCDSVTLYLSAETNYINQRDKGWKGEHPHTKVSAIIAEVIKSDFETLLKKHIEDYQSLYKRMSVDFGKSSNETSKLPCHKRVENYSKRVLDINDNAGGECSADPELESLLYQYGRYLMIASSRDGHGCLPSNLQGIWLINKRPAWRCDFHTDINIQMNYWFTPASNLAECFLPFAHWVDSIREVRKEETKKVLGVERGWLMRSENGCFGGSTWHFQKGDSAWLCQNLWDAYTFSMDKDYLKQYAYPVMKEICEFWIDHLKELPDGTLVAPEGRSPEHGPVGVDGVSYDQQLCWDLFNNTIDASHALNVDRAFSQVLTEKRNKLLGPKVGKWGQLQEWMEDIDDPEDDHRHINHMIGVYPGRQIHPSIEPKFAEAAKVGVIARGNGETGWSKVWKICVFARLLESELAYDLLSNMMATKLYSNLWTTHPPFQIDCNYGYVAGVNEMLVQSHLGIIHLLPALPKAWPKGEVKGLCVRGGFELDLAWDNHKCSKAVIRGKTNIESKVNVLIDDEEKIYDVAQGSDCIII